MQAGKATEWILELYDPNSPEPLHHFMPMHGKEVHMFAVRDDLASASFRHFHPNELGNHLGLFGIHVNEPNTDPDSQDAASAVTTAGKYFVFAEAMPMEQRMVILGVDIQATGTPGPPPEAVVPTPQDAAGASTILSEDYRVTIRHESLPHPGTFIVLVHAHIEKFDPASGSFKPVLDLEPWLLSYGHCVLVSNDGATAKDKKVLHLHAAWPIIDDPHSGSGPDLDLAADTHVPPRAGLYKAWLQFKHQGKLHAVPMAFQVNAP
jgi:hypothetical protein